MAVAVRTLQVAATTLVLAGCTTTPTAQDPVFLKLTDLEARLIRMERVSDNLSLSELATRVDQLQAETQALRGEIETLVFQTEGADSRQRELYVDVDTRLQALEEGQRQSSAVQLPPGALSGFPDGQTPSVSSGVAGSDQDNYQMAFDLLRDGRYAESTTAFDRFLTVYSSSPLADNAQYWLAETYYVQRQFTTALAAFQEVVDQYPQSAKLPDALLKIGFCNYELQQWGAARDVLQRVARDFPATTAARMATQRIERLIQEQG